MENMQITLTLALQEVQYILNKLGPHPFNEVGQLLPKIQQQAQVQIDAARAAGEASKPPPDESFAEIHDRIRSIGRNDTVAGGGLGAVGSN